jgi:hypothetical protein
VTVHPHIGDQARRLVRLVCVLVTALVLAAPLLLGPAMAPVMRALGGDPSHHCACGMGPGKCGCPECEHAGDIGQDREHPTLRTSSCDEGGTALPSFSALPAAVLPHLFRVPAPSATDTHDPLALAILSPRGRVRPPTPPPRG